MSTNTNVIPDLIRDTVFAGPWTPAMGVKRTWVRGDTKELATTEPLLYYATPFSVRNENMA